jgi:tetratricopeptide (TPR) repeat protein
MASRLLTFPSMARVMMRCWGDFGLHEAESGEDLRPRGRKARALLAYLALHSGKPVSRQRLMGLLWSERADEQARSSLRQVLFELREFSRAYPPLLHIARETVTLPSDMIETDMDRWRRLAEETDYETLLTELPDGDDTLFANLDGVDCGFDEWLRVERTRQRDAVIALIAEASAGALAAGQTRAARALHARLIEFNPEESAPAPSAPPAPVQGPEAAAAAAPSLRRRLILWPLGAALLAAAGGGSALWFRSEPPAVSQQSRQAQELYETAHAIVYQRRGAEFPTALNLLRRAVALDPEFVPAITDLAALLGMDNPDTENHAEAERLARRAIRLEPKSAMAHGVLGMILGFDSPEARSEIKKAAALDPRDPQIQFWLSNVLGNEGDYVGRLQALRRAAASAPSWNRGLGVAAVAAWEMGFPKEAESYAARLRDIDYRQSFDCSYSIDFAGGDYSGVVADTLAARERLNDSNFADSKLGMALLVLGHVQPARLLLRLPPPLWRVVSGAGPAPGELEPLMVQAAHDYRAASLALTALRQTLKARPAEVVAVYDRKVGDLGLLHDDNVPFDVLVTDGLQVALALRAVGRAAEADRLLARADAAIRRSTSHGAVPNWLPAGAAGIWVAQGRREDALAALRTSLDRGWHYMPFTPMPDMGDIPSFQSLRGDPRFEALRQRELDHLAREKRELGPSPV